MSANLIGFGCDLQQKLDAMDAKARRMRWAGDVGFELFQLAGRLHRLGQAALRRGWTPRVERQETALVRLARAQVRRLGKGITVHRIVDPNAWPMVVVFPGDMRRGDRPEEKGVAVPPRA